MPRGLVVADDLTGGCDTGHAFAATGNRTQVLVAETAPAPSVDVLVINTDGRHQEPEAEAAAVRRALERFSDSHLYLKIDSTLRGNVATAVATAMTEAAFDQPPIAVVAPAAPAVGRTTVDGWHLVDGRLVTETAVADAKERPPPSAYIPLLFDVVDVEVSRLPIDIVAQGTEAVAKHLLGLPRQSQVVVPDVTHDRHLAALASGIAEADRPIIPVGSVGLATHVANQASFARGDPGPLPESVGAGVIGIVGSTQPITVCALRAVDRQSVVTLPLEETIMSPNEALTTTINRMLSVLDRFGTAVLTSTRCVDPVGTLQQVATDCGVSMGEAVDAVQMLLATVPAELARQRTIEGLVLTGGDTATAVLDTLGVRSIELSGYAVEAGVPIGWINGGAADGASIITKAGGFGTETTIVRCLEAVAST